MEILKVWQWEVNQYYWIDRGQNLNNMLTCPHCLIGRSSSNIVKNGLPTYGKQNYRCHYCKRQLGQLHNPELLIKLSDSIIPSGKDALV